ncbi:haloacid dehalogenase-like hydrolase [Nocardia nepalensis]|uniref:haloacid dehalogenase-like hydrolase n=1 Tax=Nocardia nepalensis TaxID=3375448 RepID=UPI003B684BB0
MLVLDLDGTVYPQDSALTDMIDTRTAAFFLERAGLDTPELTALEVERPSVLDALDHLGLSRFDWARAVYADLPYTEILRPDPRLRAALVRVQVPRVVVTLAPATYARGVLAALGITELVDDLHSVFDSADVVKDRVYAKLIASQGEAANTFVIGDNPRLDLAPAAGYGCRCVLVGRTRRPQPYPTYITLMDALASISAGI